jgi:hypothetical protein
MNMRDYPTLHLNTNYSKTFLTCYNLLYNDNKPDIDRTEKNLSVFLSVFL